MIEAVIFGIVQGITEWLPISSSAHLSLLSLLLNYEQNVSFYVFLHLGTLLSVLLFFKKDFLEFLRERSNIAYIIIGSAPLLVVGFLFKEIIEGFFSDGLSIGIFLLINGFIIFSTRFFRNGKKIDTKRALFIGVMQAFSLFPGISRSGSTISASLWTGIKKTTAITFSFLLSTVSITAALVSKIDELSVEEPSPLFTGFLTSFLVGLLSLKFLYDVIRKGKFHLFSLYCFVLGSLLILFS